MMAIALEVLLLQAVTNEQSLMILESLDPVPVPMITQESMGTREGWGQFT